MLRERNSVLKDTAIEGRKLTVEVQIEANGAFGKELIPSYRIDFFIFTFDCIFLIKGLLSLLWPKVGSFEAEL